MGRADLIGGGKHQLVPAWQPAHAGDRGAVCDPGVALTQHTGLPPQPHRPNKKR